MAVLDKLTSCSHIKDSKIQFSLLLFFLSFGFGIKGYASSTASQQLLITVSAVAELSVKDPTLEVIFDPLLANGSVQEVSVSSGYVLKNTLSSPQMITANISELIEGIDIFVTLGVPAPHPEGAMNVPDVQLSFSPQTAVSGIVNCIGEGSINYKLLADFSKISNIAISQKVLTVTYTLTASGPSAG